jgi:bidirectional [NiFe] hydrogenase diaphorase subunit
MWPMNTAIRSKKARTSEPPDERFALLSRYLRRVGHEQDQLIQTLHVAQEVFGHLSPEVLKYVAQALHLPESRVYGVATFYHLFNFDPPGDHTCTVCTGTACHVKGADKILTALSEEFGVDPGQTKDDGSLTLGTTRCLGSCGLAPMLVLDGEVYSHQDTDSARDAVRSVLANTEQV